METVKQGHWTLLHLKEISCNRLVAMGPPTMGPPTRTVDLNNCSLLQYGRACHIGIIVLLVLWCSLKSKYVAAMPWLAYEIGHNVHSHQERGVQSIEEGK